MEPADDHQPLLDYLAQAHDTCPRCGYSLHRLTSSTCPECGAALRLKVGLVEPRVAAYVVTVGAACMGFGGALLFSSLAVIYAGLNWWFDKGMPSSLLLLFLLVTCGAAVPTLLLGRRWFSRRTHGVQWIAALMMLGYTLVMFVLVLALFDD